MRSTDARLLSNALPCAPDSVVNNGQPLNGRYAGSPCQVDWTGLQGTYRRSPLWRALHHKRWRYVGIATERCFVGVAMVDLGWASTMFAYVFDRVSKKMLFDAAQDGLPAISAQIGAHPAQGACSRFCSRGTTVHFDHVAGEHYQLRVGIRQHLQIQAALDNTWETPLLCAIGPIQEGGCAHATVKSSALAVTGHVAVAGQVFDLAGGVASFDYSNGLLARDTRWAWASAHSPTLGFNLQQGYFGNHENALWLDGNLIALGNAQFDFDAQAPMKPWNIRTDCGLLQLRFEPEGARSQSKNLGLAASQYVQPIGRFYGSVRAGPGAPAREVQALVGVTEDHRARW